VGGPRWRLRRAKCAIGVNERHSALRGPLERHESGTHTGHLFPILRAAYIYTPIETTTTLLLSHTKQQPFPAPDEPGQRKWRFNHELQAAGFNNDIRNLFFYYRDFEISFDGETDRDRAQKHLTAGFFFSAQHGAGIRTDSMGFALEGRGWVG
jgi:hypothetical protein